MANIPVVNQRGRQVVEGEQTLSLGIATEWRFHFCRDLSLRAEVHSKSSSLGTAAPGNLTETAAVTMRQ